jgi:formylglycine-generating enzyme required for sulfatase activity
MSGRAEAETSRYYGQSESFLEHYAWYQSNSKDRSWPVARLKPNDFGLFDMQGNASEWCYDAYGSYRGDETDEAADQPSSEEVLAGAGRRVLRGGSYTMQAKLIRSANRDGNIPNTRYGNYGFRAARTFNVSP